MKFIISNPKKDFFQKQCDKCEAIFIYQEEDAILKQSKRNGFFRRVVNCPCCNKELLHISSNKIDKPNYEKIFGQNFVNFV